jgi:hypothetical protein
MTPDDARQGQTMPDLKISKILILCGSKMNRNDAETYSNPFPFNDILSYLNHNGRIGVQ